MLSRIADSLFWMTRYTERTGSILRLLRINCITGLDRSNSEALWQPMLRVYGHLNEKDIRQLSQRTDDVLRYMILQKDNNNSLRNIVASARENARGMQDHVTKEVWESLNALYLQVNSADTGRAIERGEQIVMLSDLSDRYLLFSGVMDITMPRGQGWHYLNLGKLIERGIQTTDMLNMRFETIDYQLGDADSDIPYWRNLLLSLSGYEMYLKRYRGGFNARQVADMAIQNHEFPRSILYCVQHIDQIIHDLRHENLEGTPVLKKQTGRLRAKVEYADMDNLKDQQLRAFLGEIKQDFYQLSNTLGKTYFAYQ
jgi:uncharacterized alpha-E superfamily protein